MKFLTGKLPWLWITAAVFIADFLTKRLVLWKLDLYERVQVIPGFFDWVHVYNTGAAFSFLADGSGWQRWLFALIAIVVATILIIWIKRLKPGDTWMAIALTLILGGALGNLYDRIILGHVIDFILVHWQNRWHFPAFNLADSAITVGAVMLIIDMFLPIRKKEEEA